MENFLMSTDNNPDKYTELLKYEIFMFYFTAKELEKRPRKEKGKIGKMVFLEAFLLHTRILIDFFLYDAINENQNKKKNKNDSIQPTNIISDRDAEDLKQTVEYSKLKKLFIEEKDNNNLNLRQRIHKRLAHLSKSRINYINESNWRDTLTIILATIQCYIEKFNEKLPDNNQFNNTGLIFTNFPGTIATSLSADVLDVCYVLKK